MCFAVTAVVAAVFAAAAVAAAAVAAAVVLSQSMVNPFTHPPIIPVCLLT